VESLKSRKQRRRRFGSMPRLGSETSPCCSPQNDLFSTGGGSGFVARKNVSIGRKPGNLLLDAEATFVLLLACI